MPLVFVHGVSTRRGETPAEQAVFDQRTKFFMEQFRNIALADVVKPPVEAAIFAPYWRNLGVKFPRGLRFLPKDDLQSLTVGSPEMAPLTEATATHFGADLMEDQGATDQPFLTFAKKQSLAAAIDLMAASAATTPTDGLMMSPANVDKALKEVSLFTASASAYAETTPKPTWLNGLTTDEELVEKLLEEIEANGVGDVQSLGVGSFVKNLLANASGAVKGAVGNLKSGVATAGVNLTRSAFHPFAKKVRPTVSQLLATFLGDVFTYLEDRKPISDLVTAEIEKAIDAKKPGDDKLILVGHSFGGIILYDILSHFRKDIECDVLVTVGSQVAMFTEMGRVADKTAFPAGPDGQLKRPPNTKRWVNAADSTDFIGLALIAPSRMWKISSSKRTHSRSSLTALTSIRRAFIRG